MTIVRTTPGLLLRDSFDTNTLANYTRYEVTWSSTNKNINLGYYSYLRSKALTVADSVFTLKFKTDNWGGSPTFHARYRDGFNDSIYVSIGNVTQLMSGSTYLVYDGSVAYNTNTLYQVKMSLSGNHIKFKIWQDGTLEPSAWLYDVTDTNSVVSGGINIETSYPTLTVDNIGVYKSSNITCTGLPTGYKLRVGTITATASGGTATVDCSAVSFPVTSIEVLNSSNIVVDTISLSDGVWGGDVYSYQAAISVNVNADTSRKPRKNTTLPTNTKRKARYTSWVGTDLKRRAVVLAIAGFDSLRRIRLGTSTLLNTVRHTTAFKTIASDSTRKANKAVATVGDTLKRNLISTLSSHESVRKINSIYGITTDTYRKMRIDVLSYNATLRRRVAQSFLRANAVRRVKSAVVTSFDTGRQIITNLMALINVNLKRNIKADTVAQTDTKRRARKLAELVADFGRKVNVLTFVMGDTRRRARVLAQIAANGMRRVLTITQASVDTMRQLINDGTELINVDVKRILRVTLQVRPNAQRRLRKLTQFIGDTFQKVTVRVPVILDTFRKVQSRPMFNPDSTRKLRKASQFIADAVRRERVQDTPAVDSRRRVQVTTQARTNTWRKVKKLVQSLPDTKRRTAAVVSFVADSARNTIRRYFDLFVVDTVRRLLNIKVREAPDYSWEELDDNFAVSELDARFDVSEGIDRYSWEGDALKTYTLGEVKEVGVEITSQDGTAFSIVSATYVYKDMAGTVLSSGLANIDEHKVYVLLAPEQLDFRRRLYLQ